MSTFKNSIKALILLRFLDKCEKQKITF